MVPANGMSRINASAGPGVVMVNFMNYLHEGVDHEEWLMNNVYRPYYDAMGTNPKLVLLGYGPNNNDVRVHEVGQ